MEFCIFYTLHHGSSLSPYASLPQFADFSLAMAPAIPYIKYVALTLPRIFYAPYQIARQHTTVQS